MPLRLALVVLAIVAAPQTAAAAVPQDLLPDLDQATPGSPQVVTVQQGAIPRFHLGFDSAVYNHGAGPLIVSGQRASTADEEMVADQLVLRTDASTRTVAAIGRLRYVYSADHAHWHYLGFDHYELRRAYDYRLVAPDQKTGFCLGDRYDAYPSAPLPQQPAQPYYTGYCGYHHPEALSVEEGISVGYGDIYRAQLEGQFVDVTGVAAGEYYLVHRVNANRKLLESDYSNDAASLLIQLSWPDGTSAAPAVGVLRRCPNTDTCAGPNQQPPRLGRATADRLAAKGAARALHFRPKGFKIACSTVRSRISRGCRVKGTRRKRHYSLYEKVTYERTRSGLLYFRWVIGRKHGRVLLGKAPVSAAVAQPRQRLVAFDHAPLDDVRIRPVVDEVPRLVGDSPGGLRSGVTAK